jgi:hypothetical protein
MDNFHSKINTNVTAKMWHVKTIFRHFMEYPAGLSSLSLPHTRHYEEFNIQRRGVSSERERKFLKKQTPFILPCFRFFLS